MKLNKLISSFNDVVRGYFNVQRVFQTFKRQYTWSFSRRYDHFFIRYRNQLEEISMSLRAAIINPSTYVRLDSGAAVEAYASLSDLHSNLRRMDRIAGGQDGRGGTPRQRSESRALSEEIVRNYQETIMRYHEALSSENFTTLAPSQEDKDLDCL